MSYIINTSLMNSNLSRSINTNNPKLLSDHITSLSETKTKQQILDELNKVDQQLYQFYQASNMQSPYNSQIFGQSNISLSSSFSSCGQPAPGILASTFQNTTSSSLGVPKNNSLTDSFLRSTLGCEQKLAKQYMSILDKQADDFSKEKRIQQAKKRFAEANNYKDHYANSKPYMDKIVQRTYLKKTQPVIDNEHESYLKTQLIYLQRPIIGKKISQKQYYDKHSENVAKKINELGGMEDTVGYMEESLSKNQLKNFNKRSQFGSTSQSPFRKDSKSITKQNSSKQGGHNWVDRSRSIREALMTKFNIQ